MISIIPSKNGVPIRLTDERWAHIVEEHGELADLRQEVLQTVAEPERIVEGKAGELLALRELETGKSLVVVYRELVDDGFVITAFSTSKLRSFEKRKQVWP
ncbi:MAG TPA: hypothetical protein VNN62_20305 [Methylomirabilota bacterium]|jgi:hypothetical protein|nr:hypothetical protein [Methylomirabilota bacterium]